MLLIHLTFFFRILDEDAKIKTLLQDERFNYVKTMQDSLLQFTELNEDVAQLPNQKSKNYRLRQPPRKLHTSDSELSIIIKLCKWRRPYVTITKHYPL